MRRAWRMDPRNRSILGRLPLKLLRRGHTGGRVPVGRTGLNSSGAKSSTAMTAATASAAAVKSPGFVRTDDASTLRGHYVVNMGATHPNAKRLHGDRQLKGVVEQSQRLAVFRFKEPNRETLASR